METQPLLISMVICTYNRSNLLSAAIQSLLMQTAHPDSFEIIVVDNSSTDDTASVVKSLIALNPGRIHYVLEEKPGSGLARNTGYQVSRGKYIGFIDDDAKAPQNFIATATEIIKSFNFSVYSFGGSIHPFYLAPKPQWFLDDYEIRDWGPNSRWLEKGEALSGSNMFFRSDIFKLVCSEIPRGMTGDKMGFGEDNALFEILTQKFPNKENLIYYSPALLIYHAVPDYKMTLKYGLLRNFSVGQANFHRQSFPKKLARIRYGIRQILIAFWLTLKALFSIFHYHTWQQWVVKSLGPVVKRMGTIWAWLGINVVFNNRPKGTN